MKKKIIECQYIFNFTYDLSIKIQKLLNSNKFIQMYYSNILQNITLSLLAISDIYNVLSYGRVKTYIEQKCNNAKCLTLVSGDFISPIKYTNLDGGKLIMEVFDSVPVDYASLGNHEFDIKPNELNSSIEHNNYTKFISTNIQYISNTMEYHIYNNKESELILGFIGLCGNNFTHKHEISFISDDQINQTINYVKTRFAPDYIIGLTHAELNHDFEYIDKFPQLNMILGGHIHSYGYSEYKGVPIVRTGENADSIFRIDFYSNKSFQIDTFQINMEDISNLTPHHTIHQLYLKGEKMFEKYNEVILYNFTKPYANISPRLNQETLPQLICSLITNYFNSTITILNSGMFRKKGIFDSVFTYGDLYSLLPFQDLVIQVQMDIDDLIDGIKYSNEKYYGDGGYIQMDMNLNELEELKKIINLNNLNSKVNVGTVKWVINGIDPNPYFIKYANQILNMDGFPIHTMLLEYSGSKF